MKTIRDDASNLRVESDAQKTGDSPARYVTII